MVTDSPAAALVQRLALEEEVASVTSAALSDFVTRVRRAANHSMNAEGNALVAASRSPFSLGSVLWQWHDSVPGKVVLALARYLGITRVDQSLFLAGVLRRLEQSPLPDATYQAVAGTLTNSIQQHWTRDQTYRQITTALAGVDLPGQGQRIARTEATATFGVGSLQRISDEGFTRKRWVSHHDKRTRTTHRAADGQTQPLTSNFTVGGWALMFPADPNAPIEETANCRCTIIGVR